MYTHANRSHAAGSVYIVYFIDMFTWGFITTLKLLHEHPSNLTAENIALLI